MSKRYRTNVEDVAYRLSVLTYRDMIALGHTFKGMIEDTDVRPFDPQKAEDWASLLSDWADRVEDEYQDDQKAPE